MSSTWWPEVAHVLTTQVDSEEMQKPSVPWNEHSPLLQSSAAEQSSQSSVLPRISLGTWRAKPSSHRCHHTYPNLALPEHTPTCLHPKQSHIRKRLYAGANVTTIWTVQPARQ